MDYFGFKGKTVVVTGAASGMGEAAAKMLVDLGAEVHAVGNRKKIDVPVAKKHYADLSEKSEIDRIAEELPAKIDALFICQGIAQTADNWILVQKVNFLSVRFLAEKLVSRVSDNGSVTIISSSGGFGWQDHFDACKEVIDCGSYDDTVAWYETHPKELESAYQFSKWCVNTYVKYKVFDPMYIDRKIRINCICPGNTITGLTDEFNRNSSPTGDAEEGKRLTERLFQDSWNGRWASAEEMGYPMVAIGSRIFSYMSGQVIFFDYGLTSSWEIEEFFGIKDHWTKMMDA
jgi:NAD(P)-dependent dehydrogenase (short-subunit alcohol dehydrogenase family)